MLAYSKQTDLRSRKVGQLVGDTLLIDTRIFVCPCDVSFRRYVVSSAEVAERVVQNLMFFCSPNFGGGPRNFCGHL